ncbi:hypothetical protein DL765_006255 [Monosporascus sp. GIB2]|nr:hypothetical protein DL765_006255 [Monosporascus sp. GIB2]
MKSLLSSAALLALAAAANPPAFILAGDSTTAVQSAGGGGWGNGFLSFLEPPAWGKNLGHNGATTVSFVKGGDWDAVLGYVEDGRGDFDVYVTIQFGHNDQKPDKGISLEQFQANLERLVGEVKEAGGTPILVTSLTRRNFASEHQVEDSLRNERLATIAAAAATDTALLDLNAASIDYVNAIGEAAAHAYNLKEGDRTHLNDWGSVVFGRMVADLLLRGDVGCGLGKWIRPNETLSELIWSGLPA